MVWKNSSGRCGRRFWRRDSISAQSGLSLARDGEEGGYKVAGPFPAAAGGNLERGPRRNTSMPQFQPLECPVQLPPCRTSVIEDASDVKGAHCCIRSTGRRAARLSWSQFSHCRMVLERRQVYVPGAAGVAAAALLVRYLI